jgi:hypothetical protein
MAGKSFKARMHEYVMYRAKKFSTKNLALLVFLPFTLLGLLWGLAFFGLRTVTTSQYVGPFAGFLRTYLGLSVTNEGLQRAVSWLPFFSFLIPLFISFFYIGLFCRAVQVLLPDEFDDTTFDK